MTFVLIKSSEQKNLFMACSLTAQNIFLLSSTRGQSGFNSVLSKCLMSIEQLNSVGAGEKDPYFARVLEGHQSENRVSH